MNITTGNHHTYCTLNDPQELNAKFPVLFLHGFAGSSADWESIFKSIDSRFYPFAIDLIGHGRSSCPEETIHYEHKTLALHIETVRQFFKIDKFVLCGYSMGSRAALNYYFNYPERVAGLILESANPGIQDEAERKKRVKSDTELIARIKKDGVKSFIDYWYSLPLFNSIKNIPSGMFEDMIRNRYNNSIAGLTNSLAGFGTGVMPDYWSELKNITVPVQLIAGELDKKYTDLSFRVTEQLIYAELKIINSAGHNTHLEKPIEFVSLVNSFLRNYFVQ